MINAEKYKLIFGENFEFPQRVEVWQLRVNTLKTDRKNLVERFREKNFAFESVDWFENAFIVKTEENMSKTLEHSLGHYFLQNLSSMIPPIFLRPSEEDVILDLAASPGAKTTEIAQMMKNKGVIIANDVSIDRLKALRGNVQRCGVLNTIITQMDGRIFFKTGIKFKKILLDAPCTATGTLNPRVLNQTSYKGIRKLSEVQKQLLSSAGKMLEKEGMLVYSTCSLEPEENEENIDYAIKKLGLVPEKIDVKIKNKIEGITEWQGKYYDDSVSESIRIIPDGIMEGFFVCKLIKY